MYVPTDFKHRDSPIARIFSHHTELDGAKKRRGLLMGKYPQYFLLEYL